MTRTQAEKYLNTYKMSGLKELYDCYRFPSEEKKTLYDVYRCFVDKHWSYPGEHVVDHGVLSFNHYKFTFGFVSEGYGAQWLYVCSDLKKGFKLCGMIE